MSNTRTQKTDNVEVSLQYLANNKDPAAYFAAAAGGELSPHKGNYIMQQVSVSDGRLQQETWNLEDNGFALVPMTSQVNDFYNDQQIDDIYEAELKSLIKQHTGASRVEIFDHTRRSSSDNIRKQKQIREAAAIIHNDYTAASGVRRLQDYLRDNSVDNDTDLLNRDFAIINVWRSINGPVYNYPLAMCDANSVAAEQLVSVQRESKDRPGELQLATYSPEQRWVYFPEMQMDEALIFKTFDSIDDGRIRFTLHTSFDDPNANASAPPRESIESRCFAFFD